MKINNKLRIKIYLGLIAATFQILMIVKF